MKTRVILTLVGVLCIALLLSQLGIDAAPPRPASFYGTVRVNGEFAPSFVTVEARIQGITYASRQVQVVGSEVVYAIDVPGDVPETPGKEGGTSGEIIYFWVSGLQCAQTQTWEEGKRARLDLTATGTLPTLTPTSTASPTPTQTHTPAATRIPTEVIFRNQAGIYDGCVDTFLDADNPTTNYGNDGSLKIKTFRQYGNKRPVIRFDISSIPSGSTVLAASLELRATDYSSTDEGMYVSVYGLKQSWEEMEASWENRLARSYWGAGGADSTMTDRDELPSDTKAVEETEVWYEWNVQSLVQAWVNGTRPNYGMILIAEGLTVEKRFWSSEYGIESWRPLLYVRYVEATPTPVATNTPTPTPTPTASLTPSLGGINGTVVKDLNANGRRDAGEPGVEGATVQLWQGGSLLQWQITGSSGTFAFNDLTPGTYMLREIDPPGYWSSSPNDSPPLMVVGGAITTHNFFDVPYNFVYLPVLLR